jgi:hypothetical protein
MGFIGRMLTLLIFFMSIVFMTLAVMVFATHKSWKEEITSTNGYQAQVKRLRQENDNLKLEIDSQKRTFAAEQMARAFALGALQSKLTQLESQIQQKDGQLAQLQTEVANKTTLASTTAQNEAKLQVEVEQQRELITKTREEADGLFLSVVALTDQLNQAKGIERSQGEINAALLRQYADLKLVADKLGFGPYTLVQEIPPPVDAKVLAVSEKDLIEISVGSDDGVHKGHTMEVYRGTNYLGKVVVLKTEGNKAIAKIIPEYRKAPIKKDDHVTTRLN